MTRREPDEFRSVYFIESERLGMIKIGSASDPDQRRARLQTGSADRLNILGTIQTDDAPRLERVLHDHYKADRLHGEWFSGTDEMRSIFAPPEPDDLLVDAVCFAPLERETPVLRIMRDTHETSKSFVRRLQREAAAAGIKIS